MNIKLFVVVLLALLLLPVNSYAIEQEVIDTMVFFLLQPEYGSWEGSNWDDNTLIEGLTVIYNTALVEDKPGLRTQALWAMGESGLVEFLPLLVSAIDNDPIIVCPALGKLQSEYAIPPIIAKIDHEDDLTREAAIRSLGKFGFYANFPDARDNALEALNNRLAIETKNWIIESILFAISTIESQQNQPPDCCFEVLTPMPYIGEIGDIQFDASGSSDPDEDPLTFSWDFDGDCILNDPFTGEPDTPIHTYTMSYYGPVMLLVSDGINECYYTQFVDVTIIIPDD